MAAEEHEGPFAALPAEALAELPVRPFGIYVHVPFCASRCGYCAFTTYTAADLGGDALRRGYPAAAAAEVALAARTLGDSVPEVRTVFFGGGTPTLLDPAELLSILRAVKQHFPVAADVEVTVEANPDSVDRASLAALRAGGVTRVSFGMQSVRSHVLAVLERSHTPGAAARAVADAHDAGFDHISLDLIYGTPGETDDDWRASLEAALAAGPDHVSAYALTIEPRTRLAAQVRSGRLPEPDEDALVRRYALADDLLTAAGYRWYELSNWARTRDARCRHNLGLVGHRTRCPQPRRRGAVVERRAPGGACRGGRPGGAADRRTRAGRHAIARDRARAVGCPTGRRRAARRTSRVRGGSRDR
jgi:oxygen-independent coproporphyrinogen-3 oxidase